MRKKRPSVPINAGSMADIAFLLLIFFLVSTQIIQDKGIKILLPEYSEFVSPPGRTNKKILKILINSENELMVNGEVSDILLLKDQIKSFVLNPNQNNALPPRPDKAIISISSDDETSYERYVQVYSEIKKSYIEMWIERSRIMYGKPIEKLTREEIIQVKEIIPLNISELEKRQP